MVQTQTERPQRASVCPALRIMPASAGGSPVGLYGTGYNPQLTGKDRFAHPFVLRCGLYPLQPEENSANLQ